MGRTARPPNSQPSPAAAAMATSPPASTHRCCCAVARAASAFGMPSETVRPACWFSVVVSTRYEAPSTVTVCDPVGRSGSSIAVVAVSSPSSRTVSARFSFGPMRFTSPTAITGSISTKRDASVSC